MASEIGNTEVSAAQNSLTLVQQRNLRTRIYQIKNLLLVLILSA